MPGGLGSYPYTWNDGAGINGLIYYKGFGPLKRIAIYGRALYGNVQERSLSLLL
jgi:hypothetical protein